MRPLDMFYCVRCGAFITDDLVDELDDKKKGAK